MKVIHRCLEYIDSEEQRHHNLAASTTAKLCLQLIGIAHAFSGSRSRPPKQDIKPFLPFPDWSPENAQPDGPSPETREILTKLLKSRRIPLSIYAQLITPPDVSR